MLFWSAIDIDSRNLSEIQRYKITFDFTLYNGPTIEESQFCSKPLQNLSSLRKGDKKF